MFDTVIKDGFIVFPDSAVQKGNLGITAGKIAAIVDGGTNLEGKVIIDASGKYIFPGVIEPHSHIGLGAGAEDLITETRCAALGGVTSVLFFLRQPTPYDALYHEVKQLGEQKSFIDFSFHIVLLTDEHLASVPKYVGEWGVNSFKFYLTYRGADAKMGDFYGKPQQFSGIDNGFMLDCFHAVAGQRGAIITVHAEDIEIVNRCKKKLQEEQRDDMEAWVLSRPLFAELEGIRRVLSFARETNCPVNILHLTSEAALTEVNLWREKLGVDNITVEVCHPYLLLNETNASSKKYKLRPPLRKAEDNEALWQGIINDEIATIGSDHVPRKLAEKMGSVWGLAAGAPGTPFLLPIMLSEGYHKRGISLPKIARLLSKNPARLYNLYPQKGDIAIGCDADIVVVDLDKEYSLTAAGMEQYSDYILYEGLKMKGYPEMTLVRGKIVARDGRIENDSGWGKYCFRTTKEF